jgi:hypothetical protein
MGALESMINGKHYTPEQDSKIKENISLSISIIAYYELTNQLLAQFKSIAPDLYHEINTIKDGIGRPVDVYIRFTPKNATVNKSWGTTYIDQCESDPDAYYSAEFGISAVSIKVWNVNQALQVLSHELGHVKYQVPHLRTYFKYYRENYLDRHGFLLNDCSVGHLPTDHSGISALNYEKRYRKCFHEYLKRGGEKIEPPSVMLGDIKRNLDAQLNQKNVIASLKKDDSYP